MFFVKVRRIPLNNDKVGIFGSRNLSTMVSNTCSGCKYNTTPAGNTCANKALRFSSIDTPKFNERFVNPIKNISSDSQPEYERLDDLSELLQLVECKIPSLKDQCTKKFLLVQPEVLQKLTYRAFVEIMHFLRPTHLRQLRTILEDPDASANDRFVAMQLLKNACISAGRVLPGCQDTGTAIVIGKRGNMILSEKDASSISKGIYEAYVNHKFRYSQMAPISMYEEVNTKCNLPAQIELYSQDGEEYEFLFVAKGGGSANKTFLYQQTKAILNNKALLEFLMEQIKKIGTSACPPYHLAIVIGGLSAEMTLKTVKLASCKYLDALPTQGSPFGDGFRDLELEELILEKTRVLGIGAQFGGKYFCHDVRVVRLPRHGASCPIGIGVSCSADRQILGKINSSGVFLEKLEQDPAQYLPALEEDSTQETIKIDLSMGMEKVLEEVRRYPVKTRLSLSGPLIVARDIAHAKLSQMLEEIGELPDYVKEFPIYYAGPAKRPEGYASGSFGPTTAGRMDSYAKKFMERGGSLITLAKGNRSRSFVDACRKYGGVYLGSVGGPAALITEECITSVEVIDFPELGMEAVHKIVVKDFPAFVIVDSNGNDFYAQWCG